MYEVVLDWTRWPYDPEKIDGHVMADAVAGLQREATDGAERLKHALHALDTAQGMVPAWTREHDQHGSILASLDRTNIEVRRYLDDAMDAVYKAAAAISDLHREMT